MTSRTVKIAQSVLRTGLLPLLLGMVLLAPGGVSAQVIRCTDPGTGKVTYTDSKCANGNAALEVEPRKSTAEINAERERATEAWERKRERQSIEAERDELQALRQREQQRAERNAYRESQANNPANSAACQQARRDMQDVQATLGRGMYDEQSRLDSAQRQVDQACLTPEQWARAQQNRNASVGSYAPTYPYGGSYYPPVVRPPRPQLPPQPVGNVHCTVFRCTDSKGNVFPPR